MFKEFNLKELIALILTSEIIGVIFFVLSGADCERYNVIPHPPLTPNYWLFITAWVMIYVVASFAFYIIMLNIKEDQIHTLAIYFFWLISTFVWNILFFSFSLFFIAFIFIIFESLILFYTAKCFYKIKEIAAVLLLPILLWLMFQAYLTLGVWILDNGNVW